jgi:hypothetical protein
MDEHVVRAEDDTNGCYRTRTPRFAAIGFHILWPTFTGSPASLPGSAVWWWTGKLIYRD